MRGWGIEKGSLRAAGATLFDLLRSVHKLAVSGGFERSKAEHRGLIEVARLKLTGGVPAILALSVIEVKPN